MHSERIISIVKRFLTFGDSLQLAGGSFNPQPSWSMIGSVHPGTCCDIVTLRPWRFFQPLSNTDSHQATRSRGRDNCCLHLNSLLVIGIYDTDKTVIESDCSIFRCFHFPSFMELLRLSGITVKERERRWTRKHPSGRAGSCPMELEYFQ